MTLYPKLIMDALATVTYAGTKKNLVESGMVADTPSINGMKVRVVLEFPRDTDPFLKSTVKAAEAAIHYHVSQDVEVEILTEFKSKPRPELEKLLPHITLRLNYSFDPETDADTTDITVGELLLVVNSMLDRKTETEPENCFEELADYLEEYGEFMFECIFMMLGMVGDKLKYEKGESL